eukprot:COSAG01_NODE_99_length_26583_cov_79.512536_20_plen_258_part_00
MLCVVYGQGHLPTVGISWSDAGTAVLTAGIIIMGSATVHCACSASDAHGAASKILEDDRGLRAPRTFAATDPMKLAALAPLLALLSRGTAQTTPPPPSCSIATIQTRVTEVNRACCVPQSICKSGTPSQCNSQCAHIFLSFYQQCYADLAGFMKEQITVFDELSKKCQVVAPKHSCLSENHAMQVLQYMECAKTQADIVHRTRCVQRALSVLGLQGSRPSNPADSCLALDVNLPLLAGTPRTPYPPTLPPRALPSLS